MQELYEKIKQLEQCAGTVYCHCDESDSVTTETKPISQSMNTDDFVSKAVAAQSNTSTTPTETWLTTDSDTKDGGEEMEEMEEIRILTVIEMTQVNLSFLR